MIISHKHKYIFLRVPKTACTSIEIELSKTCGPKDVITPLGFWRDPEGRQAGFKGPQNHHRNFWKLQPNDWFRLIFLRKDPKDLRHATAEQIKRMVGGNIWDSYHKFCGIRNPFDRAISLFYWQNKGDDSDVDLNDYILCQTYEKLSTWYRYIIGNMPAMNSYCRYENLQSDFDTVSNLIGIPPVDLPHAKATLRKNHKHYSQLINFQARSHIEKVCAAEIEFFNYKWESG